MCSGQLEYLEDKLREYRFINNFNSEQRAVLLGQLDNIRREVVQVIQNNFPRISFGKEVVKEVLAFASAGDDTPRGYTSSSTYPSNCPSPNPRSNQTSPPPAASTLFGMVHSPQNQNAGANATKTLQPTTKFNTSYNNELWESQHRKSTAVSSAKTAYASVMSDSLSDALTGASRSRRYASTRPGSTAFHITDEDIYGPPCRSSSHLLGDAQQDQQPSSKVSTMVKRMVLSKKPARADNTGTTTDALDQTTTTTATTTMGQRPPCTDTTYGGVVKIRDMLAKAEQRLSLVAEAAEQRRSVPRIFGAGAPERNSAHATEIWDGMDDPGIHGEQATFAGLDGEGSRLWTPASMVCGAAAMDDSALQCYDGANEASLYAAHGADGEHDTSKRSAKRAARYSSALFTPPTDAHHQSDLDARSDRSSSSSQIGGGLPGLVGKLAGFAFVLGSIAAATMAATGTLHFGQNDGKNNPHAEKKKTTIKNGSSSDQQSSRRGKSSHQPSDIPPWKDADTPMNMYSNTMRGTRKGSPSSAKRSSASGGDGENRVAPVMHVHNPPSTGSFPAAPPDVTAAMG